MEDVCIGKPQETNFPAVPYRSFSPFRSRFWRVFSADLALAFVDDLLDLLFFPGPRLSCSRSLSFFLDQTLYLFPP